MKFPPETDILTTAIHAGARTRARAFTLSVCCITRGDDGAGNGASVKQPDKTSRKQANRLRSALFLDFDNVFGGLLGLDRQAAMTFATSPLEWLDQLSTFMLPPDTRRDMLVRRAYLNPHGSIPNNEGLGKKDRIHLSSFRPNLTCAGFEVVDCPPLTARHKNAADIRIVLDVLDYLASATRYDEVLIASSDADFTPLLLRLRAEDRRTIIIAAGPTSPAYQSVADVCLDEEAIISLISACASYQSIASNKDNSDAQAENVVRRTLSESNHALSLAALGGIVRREVGSEIIDSTNWYGAGSFGGFIRAMGGIKMDADSQYAWDPARHSPPTPASPKAAMTAEQIEQRRQAELTIRQKLAESPSAVLLSYIGGIVRDKVGSDVVDNTDWFGYGGLAAFIRSFGKSDLAVRGHHVWDFARHAEPPEPMTAEQIEQRRQAELTIRQELTESPSAVLLAQIGDTVRDKVGSDVVNNTDWFGYGGLAAFIRSFSKSDLAVRGHHVWDIARHAEPPELSIPDASMPPIIAQICQVTNFPRLPTADWAIVLDVAANYRPNDGFSIGQCTAWIRDRLSENNLAVTRGAISIVVRYAHFGGASLGLTPPPNADQIRAAILRTIMDRAQSAGLQLDESQEQQFQSWLAGKG